MKAAARSDNRVNIIQGEFFVTEDPSIVVTTILGSCVAACIRDPLAGVGGINHFLLPGKSCSESSAQAERIGVHLMELLVNGLLKCGARRERLEAKLFGGAQTVRGLCDIGTTNVEFAAKFLRDEGIAHVGGSTGGLQGRRIQYWPVSGRARQIMLAGPQASQRPAAASVPAVDTNAGELELF